MKKFSTIDINGNSHTFQYLTDFNDLDDEVTFRVFSIPANEMRFFSYRVKIINNNIAKGEQFSNFGNSEFIKKGIPEKIIQIASSELNRDIKSSLITFQEGNYLTPPSRKAWERLVAESENAFLDSENDCFIYKRVFK
jgi:hypothetical protein